MGANLDIDGLAGSDLAPRIDALLLGRLGKELAHVYHETLNAPPPAGLQRLIDRLELALRTDSHASRDDG